MVDDVAKALCKAAGMSNSNICSCCRIEDNKLICVYWETFRDEAREAIKAAYLWNKKERRWPSFCGR